jgi:hypothetical protein
MDTKYDLETADEDFPGKGDSIIQALRKARVVSITENDGIVAIRERCDEFYEAYLTKEDLIAFSIELLNLAVSIKEK